MVHAACTGAAQLLSIVVRKTVSHAPDILRIGNSCGCFANWCVRTFIRTYVHVQKVWHLKKKKVNKIYAREKTWAHEASVQGMALGENVVCQCHTALESGMAFAGPAGLSTPPLMYMYTLWFTRLHAHEYVMSA